MMRYPASFHAETNSAVLSLKRVEARGVSDRMDIRLDENERWLTWNLRINGVWRINLSSEEVRRCVLKSLDQRLEPKMKRSMAAAA
jgi:hypothetical protein